MLLGTVAFSWCFARSHSQCSIPGQKGRLEVAGTQEKEQCLAWGIYGVCGHALGEMELERTRDQTREALREFAEIQGRL